MKRLLLASSCLLLVLPDIAAAAGQATTRPAPGSPQVQPVRPGRPTPPATRPPRPRPPGNVANPPRPVRPPVTRPVPLPKPQRPGRPHRPGAGRPPNFHPIHRPGWVYPPGYRYRRWSIGLFLPSLFLASRYYYDSYWEVGLQPPPPGYRWVRYGPDVLLVQLRTRRIVDVIHGAFL